MRALSVFLGLALTTAHAFADPSPPAVNGPLAAALARSAVTPGIDADEAGTLLDAMLERWNGPGGPASALDPDEQALLARLGEASAPFAVILDGREQATGPLLPDGRRILDLVFRGTADPLNLWLGPDDATTLDLARLYALRSPRLREEALSVVAPRIDAAWRSSSVGSGYEPLSSDIGKAAAIFEAAAPATRKAGRRMLHDALQRVDAMRNGAMPDFLYDFLKGG